MNDLLKSLESLYLEGKYDEAREQLLKNKLDFGEGVFHYNLGTLLSKSGNTAAGRYHFEKAQKSGYVDTKNLNNLEYVKSQLQVNDISNSDEFSDQLTDGLMSLPMSLYISMTLILFLSFLLAIKFKAITNKYIKVAVVLFAFAPMVFNQMYIKPKKFAISLKEIKLFEGPSKVYEEKGIVPAGCKFLLGRFDKGWAFIERPVQLSGWVKIDALGIF